MAHMDLAGIVQRENAVEGLSVKGLPRPSNVVPF